MRLSILIASLFERHSLLMRLLGSLAHQADRRGARTFSDDKHRFFEKWGAYGDT
jgi:hypothetical protein